METFIKEKEIVHDDYNNGGGHNLRGKANWGLGLGIAGTVLGAAALARQGGLGGILGVGAPAPAPSGVTYNVSSPACCTPSLYEKECEDILNVTKGMYDLAIAGLKSASAAREVDVAEKFGLYKDNRDNIDRVNNRINAELFSLYKYTRDKDDETSDKIAALESQVAVNAAVRPYQDKLIQCEIEKNFVWLKNYFDSKMCNVIRGVNTLPLTPTVTGVIGQNCCYQFAAAAADAATPGA